MTDTVQPQRKKVKTQTEAMGAAPKRKVATETELAGASAGAAITVSGRYILASASPQSTFVLRVDVDRDLPQQRMSLELSTQFPKRLAHVVGEVTGDKPIAAGRRVTAKIVYRDGDANLLPGDELVFEAAGETDQGYSSFRLLLVAGGATLRNLQLAFQSPSFDDVEFEIDYVQGATPITNYRLGSHSVCAPGLDPNQDVSLDSAFKRAGFNASISPNPSAIPLAGAGANATWSNEEMHNAMVTYWSRFDNKPRWALWVLFAAQHDMGARLGGVMFDDIGPNHRQGTAIFTNSFISQPPAGDPQGAAWVQRMTYWTAVHEMGHAFNLAHSWQKSLGEPAGGPWVPLMDEPEARSFMNYPYNVSGGVNAFFGDFEYRFSDNELRFMRHAPRRFVQMGNEDWFKNHAFEDGAPGSQFKLELRPNREVNVYRFLEPVNLELKLTNQTPADVALHENVLTESCHLLVLVRRDGGPIKRWRPFVSECQQSQGVTIKAKDSIYASYLMGASTSGWLIDEPGVYTVQAAVVIEGELVMSNSLRLAVAAPASQAESAIAPDYFTEEVARVIAFKGCPALEQANDVLRDVQRNCPDNPASIHAAVSLASPLIGDYKMLHVGRNRGDLVFAVRPSDIDRAARGQMAALTAAPGAAAHTLGNIDYRNAVEKLSTALQSAGERGKAAEVQQTMIDTMALRGVRASVLEEARLKLQSFS